MKKMKAFTSALMVILVVFSSIYTVFAAVYIEDWGFRFEKVNNGSAYEVNKYIGNDSVVNIPDNYNGFQIISVGEYAFVDTSISSVTLGKHVTEVKNGAFINVTTLTSAVLNDTLTDIGSLAFAGCTGLTELTIPASVSTIADDAFTNCDNLVIKCYTDSMAHQYAEAKDIEYVLIDAPVEVEFILGDVDNSGNVDIVDATFAQRYTTHADIPADILDGMVMRGDVDENEDLDSADVTFIMRHLIRVATPYSIGETVTRVI